MYSSQVQAVNTISVIRPQSGSFTRLTPNLLYRGLPSNGYYEEIGEGSMILAAAYLNEGRLQVLDQDYAGCCIRTSENPQKAKFAEFLFHALR